MPKRKRKKTARTGPLTPREAREASRYNEIFIENVKARLDELGWSICQLAREAKLNRPGLSRALSGKESVTIPRAEQIADAIGESLPSLLVK